MMDDLWYSTNLSTGESLGKIKDVLESQIWHYFNWGGRSVTHTFLQFVLMAGELTADILNVLAAAVLGAVISLFVPREHRLKSFCLAEVLILILNPDVFYSMMWQSGSVNYLYSTCWILCFVYVYFRAIDVDKPTPKGINLWIIPLALITGWSNENMGPASFCIALITTLYIWQKKKTRPPLWMTEGIIFSLAGSVLCILAPGNFVRSEFAGGGSLLDTIRDRFMSMLAAGGSFLVPSVVVLILVIVFSWVYCREKPDSKEILLLIMGILAYGAMILSPHFPARATFGIMAINIVLIVRMLAKIVGVFKDFGKVCDWLYGIGLLIGYAFLIINITG